MLWVKHGDLNAAGSFKHVTSIQKSQTQNILRGLYVSWSILALCDPPSKHHTKSWIRNESGCRGLQVCSGAQCYSQLISTGNRLLCHKLDKTSSDSASNVKKHSFKINSSHKTSTPGATTTKGKSANGKLQRYIRLNWSQHQTSPLKWYKMRETTMTVRSLPLRCV